MDEAVLHQLVDHRRNAAGVGDVLLDAWQRRGLGTALIRRLHAHAARSGLAAVTAHLTGDNVAMLRTLRRAGADAFDRDGAMVSVTLPAGRETPATSG